MNKNPLHILTLAGSLRRDSYNQRLLHAAGALAPPDLSFVHTGLAGVPLFNEDLEAELQSVPEGVRHLRHAIEQSDGLLIATPEYNQSFSGVLKNTIDWLSRPAPNPVLTGKPIAIVGVTTGPWGTRFAQAALRQVLTATEALVLPTPAFYGARAERCFGEDGSLSDPTSRRQLAALLTAFATWIRTLGPCPSPRPGPDVLQQESGVAGHR